MTGQNTSNDSISCNLSCMCAPKYIKIYKGYDTYFNGKHLIHIGFVGLYAETDKTYRFTLGGITKTYTGITDGFFVDLTKAETATLPLGPLNGSIIAIDSDGHETPMTTAIPFIIENWVSGDIVVDQNEINIDVIEGETPQFKITILSPYFETILHNDLRDRDAENCHPISAITGLQTALDSKQDVIQDLEQIRAGAALGATSVQTVGTGTANGTIEVDGNDVSVKGLGSAAFENTTAFDAAGSASAAETSAKDYAKSYADSLAPNYATAEQGQKADTAVQTIQTGTNNGTISVDGTDVAVKGLGSAAYTPSSDYDASGSASTAETNAKNYADSLAPNYATAEQGQKADTAVQTIETGTTDGTISVDGTEVAVAGLGSAAYTASTDYATSAQGALADSALQPTDVIDDTVSTDTDKPLSANMGKSLQDQVDNLKARGRFLALWNCATGLAQTNPPTGTYEYKAGDYFIIGTVATGGAANYRPTGSSYTTGVASTVVETADVAVDDVYYYDGTNWALQINTQKTVGFENIAGSPYDNSNLSSALNDKQDVLTEGAGIDIDSTTNTISNSGVRSVSTGITNGTLSINTGGTNEEVAVAGLGSAAYTQSSDYATSAQGSKADSAIQSIATGSANGTISVDGTDVSVKGLDSAAYTPSTDYATAAQGSKADTAVQPGDLATVATTGAYGDLSGQPTIPTVNDATITITQGGVTKGSFTLNQSSAETIALDAGGGGGASSLTDIAAAGTAIEFTNQRDDDYTVVGSPTITSGIATGFSSTNYIKKTLNYIPLTDAEFTIRVNPTQHGAYHWVINFPSISAGNVGFDGSGNLFLNGAGGGSVSYPSGSYMWIRLVYTIATGTWDLYGLADNGYTLDTLPALSNWTLAKSAVRANPFNGEIRLGGPDSYLNGYIDLNNTELLVDGSIAWRPIGYVSPITTINAKVMTGASSGTAGATGLVPAPAAGDQAKFLRGDGTWQTVGGGYLTDIANAGKGIKFSSYPVGSDYNVVGTGATVSGGGIASGFTSSSYVESSTLSQTSFTSAEVITMVNPTSFSGTMDIIGFSSQQGIPIGFPYSQGYLGIYTSYPWTVGSTLHTAGTNLWVKVVQTLGTSIKVYSLVDNGYNLDTLPDISSWTLEATKEGNHGTLFSGTVRFGKAYATDEHFNGTIDLTKTAVYVDGTLIWRALNFDGKTTINADIATSVNSSSTNNQPVGAKLFYDTCGDIETLINAL